MRLNGFIFTPPENRKFVHIQSYSIRTYYLINHSYLYDTIDFLAPMDGTDGDGCRETKIKWSRLDRQTDGRWILAFRRQNEYPCLPMIRRHIWRQKENRINRGSIAS